MERLDGCVVEFIESRVRKLLLENPRVRLPHGAAALFSSLETPQQRAIVKNDFFPQGTSLEPLKDDLLRNPENYPRSLRVAIRRFYSLEE